MACELYLNKLPKIKTKNQIQISFFRHPTLKPITSGNKGLSCVLPIKASVTTKPRVDVEYYPISFVGLNLWLFSQK